MARYVFRCPMRWSDVDAYGHVNNVQYLRYLEEARINLLFTVGGRAGLYAHPEGAVLARQEIDFRQPLAYRPGGVDVELWVQEVTARKVVLDYRVQDEGVLYATARSVLVPYDIERRAARPVSEPERAFLERYRDDSDSGPG